MTCSTNDKTNKNMPVRNLDVRKLFYLASNIFDFLKKGGITVAL